MNYFVMLLGVFFLISCGGQREEGNDQSKPQTSGETVSTFKEAPGDTIQGSLQIEGRTEQVELRLYRSPDNWPLKFYTYLPPDVEVNTIRSGNGEAIQFSFEDAQLQLLVFSEGMTKSIAQPLAMKALGTTGVQSCESAWPWQWKCFYATNTPETIARALLGKHEDRFFYFLIRHPVSSAEAFEPRYKLILEHWQWGVRE